MGISYSTYVGPYLHIRGDARAFFYETHVDRMIEISSDNGLDLPDGECVAISNQMRVGHWAGPDNLCVKSFTEPHTPHFANKALGAFLTHHIDDICALRDLGCELAPHWGVISWAS